MGNFSRDTFDEVKHYVSIRLQQGVPIIDADWNEQDDIRRVEVEAFLRWFIGDGVPYGNDGFALTAVAESNDFEIAAGRCLVSGREAINEVALNYTDQALFEDVDLADAWGVDVLPALSTPEADRTDIAYLDVWEREVDSVEDPDLVNPDIGLETCVRIRREWVVRVVEGGTVPAPSEGHVFYELAEIRREGGNAQITEIEDLRHTGLSLAALTDEIAEARGTRASLSNRLDVALTASGDLRSNTVGADQVIDGTLVANALADSAVTTAKLADSAVVTAKLANGAVTAPKLADGAVTTDNIGGLAVTNAKIAANSISSSKLVDGAVTREKLNLEVVANGSEANIPPDTIRDVLVEGDVPLAEGKTSVYMPVISITAVEGAGLAQVTVQMLYRASTGSPDNFDVYLRITNLAGGSEEVDVIWYVYTFGEANASAIVIDDDIVIDGDIIG